MRGGVQLPLATQILRMRARILVAEDNETDFLLFKRAVAKCGNSGELIWAQDGQVAMDRLSDQSFATGVSMIVSDLNMPRADGFELLQFTDSKAFLRGIPFIVLTSSSSSKHRERARKLGADLFIEKPVHPRELADIARRLNAWSHNIASKGAHALLEMFAHRLASLTFQAEDGEPGMSGFREKLAECGQCAQWTREWILKSEASIRQLKDETEKMKKMVGRLNKQRETVDTRLLSQCELMAGALEQQWSFVKISIEATERQIAQVGNTPKMGPKFQRYIGDMIKTSLLQNQRRINWLLNRIQLLEDKLSRISAKAAQA
jgi:CheY-like chemotaxis protein